MERKKTASFADLDGNKIRVVPVKDAFTPVTLYNIQFLEWLADDWNNNAFNKINRPEIIIHLI